MTPLLECRSLSKTFPPRTFALRGVTFQMENQETLALVGGSGCGKSTLAKILVGLLSADAGEILWAGKALLNLHRKERASLIQMIFQDPYASLNPKLTIGTQLAEILGPDRKQTFWGAETPSKSQNRTSTKEVSVRIGNALEQVGIPTDAVGFYPFQFSGGQRQRIAIARALLNQPRLLVADEPLSSLDFKTQSQVLDLFKQLRRDLGLSMIFITHDLALAAEVADRMLVMQEGVIVEEGPAQKIYRQPSHAYSQALVRAVPKPLH